MVYAKFFNGDSNDGRQQAHTVSRRYIVRNRCITQFFLNFFTICSIFYVFYVFILLHHRPSPSTFSIIVFSNWRVLFGNDDCQVSWFAWKIFRKMKRLFRGRWQSVPKKEKKKKMMPSFVLAWKYNTSLYNNRRLWILLAKHADKLELWWRDSMKCVVA